MFILNNKTTDKVYLATSACNTCGDWNAKIDYISLTKVPVKLHRYFSEALTLSDTDGYNFLARHHLHHLVAEEVIGCKCTRHENNLAAASAAIAADKEVRVTLREKGDTWTTTAKPAECWLEWGLGKVWWEPGEDCGPCPEWAADLRGEWDNAWR